MRVPRCDLLVLAAFLPELVGFEGLLGPSMRTEIGGLIVAARPVGIGLATAAVGAALRLEQAQPRAVVLVGTAGAYPGSGLKVGDLLVARGVTLVEPAVVEDEAAFPDPMSARAATHPGMSAAIMSPHRPAIASSGLRQGDVATTLAITTSDALAARLEKASGAAVEHLEAFAVATACASAGVAFAAVLGVANAVGSRGRAEWRANHASAGGAAAGFVARWIQAGASGVPHA